MIKWLKKQQRSSGNKKNKDLPTQILEIKIQNFSTKWKHTAGKLWIPTSKLPLIPAQTVHESKLSELHKKKVLKQELIREKFQNTIREVEIHSWVKWFKNMLLKVVRNKENQMENFGSNMKKLNKLQSKYCKIIYTWMMTKLWKWSAKISKIHGNISMLTRQEWLKLIECQISFKS